MKFTKPTRQKDVKREWHLIDVADKVLGRETTKIAQLLTGKGKPDFVRNLDLGDYVVVLNAKNVKVTGKKEDLKKYYRHSGYPGGFRSETFSELLGRKPEEIIKHAVSGMLPQNRLKSSMLKRLHVFAGSEHNFSDKFKN